MFQLIYNTKKYKEDVQFDESSLIKKVVCKFFMGILKWKHKKQTWKTKKKKYTDCFFFHFAPNIQVFLTFVRWEMVSGRQIDRPPGKTAAFQLGVGAEKKNQLKVYNNFTEKFRLIKKKKKKLLDVRIFQWFWKRIL